MKFFNLSFKLTIDEDYAKGIFEEWLVKIYRKDTKAQRDLMQYRFVRTRTLGGELWHACKKLRE